MLTLTTNRLFIKSPHSVNPAEFLNYLLRNNEFFKPYIPYKGEEYYSLENIVTELLHKSKLFDDEMEMRFFIFHQRDERKVIGDFCFSNIIKGHFLSCFLGYKMDEHFINKGYMGEALRAGIQYIFEQLKLHRIEANVMPFNVPSIRLLEKLNFHQEGLAQKYIIINGEWQDHLRFALINED